MCGGLVPDPDSEEECREYVDLDPDPVASSPGTDCLCENCLDSFGACYTDPYCQGIMRCAFEAGCRGYACLTNMDLTPGPCADEINTANLDSPTSVTVSSLLGNCDLANDCL